MPIPPIPDVMQVQVRMQKDSGLPEDVFINTWYFRYGNLTGAPEAAASAFDVLNAFYGDINAPGTAALSALMPAYFSAVNYRVYDLAAPAPRQPVVPSGGEGPDTPASWLPTGNASNSLPEEVACVLSFRSGPGPRRLGRVYLGPFVATTNQATAGRTRPSDALRNAMVGGAIDMLNSSENATWSQVSPTDGVANDVVEGWVDDAWDTQRSRGSVATLRNTFPTA